MTFFVENESKLKQIGIILVLLCKVAVLIPLYLASRSYWSISSTIRSIPLWIEAKVSVKDFVISLFWNTWMFWKIFGMARAHRVNGETEEHKRAIVEGRIKDAVEVWNTCRKNGMTRHQAWSKAQLALI